MNLTAPRIVAIALVLLVNPGPVSGDWWLWQSPNDDTEALDQSQVLWTNYGIMQNGHGVGQSFVPRRDVLYRLDFMIKNRSDRRPFTIKLWQWVDLDSDGQTEDAEYGPTVSNPPLWQDTISLPGTDERVLATFFPRINVFPDVPHYVEFSNATADGEWGVYIALGAEDSYADGRLRLNGFFRGPPVRPEYMDMSWSNAW